MIIDVNPSIASTYVVKYSDQNKRALVGIQTFGSAGVNTTTNAINIDNHGYSSGDKVIHLSSNPCGGLENDKIYYIIKVDDNNFKLGETPVDVIDEPIRIIELSSTGGSHEFSLINPKIEVIKNNNLVFGVGHSSLEGFEFKLYHDQDFKNEFVSTGTTNTFQVTGIGTVGIGTTSINKIDDATVTLNYYEDNPNSLYYNLQKSGYISTSDTIDVNQYSTIEYNDSVYDGEFEVFDTVSTGCLLYTSDAADE